ncbi:M14 family zinc carboxypeptidase, partial [Flavobacterium sp.]|uniref:M14 family zinc carboxypeptidase n=1 Tax=Flavobacterium sp. TaxID=239 RepID=UPI0037521A89
MKKFTFILILTVLFTSTLFAQKGGSLEKANRYLREKGEVILHFKATSKAQFLELNEFLSISHKHVDEQLLEVEAYANNDQFKRFLTYGIQYEVLAEDNEVPLEFYTNSNKATAAWDTTWDAYPKYSEYVAKMQFWATTYPSICTLQTIGSTPNGRTLYVLKISDNATADETEPEFFYSSSMHGDEITGYPTMLHFIDELLTNYGTDTEITNVVNGTELFICPLANPDGSYKTTGNDTMNSVGNTATRGNAAGVDMNRNYPDFIGGIHPDVLAFQTETTAFLNFEQTRNFVLSANYHGGAEVVNFPWDTSNGALGTSAVSIHPQDAYFRYVSRVYAEACQIADGNLNYMDDVYGTGQYIGTTNGAIWYTVKGGRQDFNTYFNHNKEVTVEISAVKFPAAANLPFHWVRNRQALLNYVKEASYGIQGIVTDQAGFPIHAKVYVNGTSDGFGGYVETSPSNGDYHKVQIAGTYNVIFEAAGYATQTISATITNGAATILNVTMIPSTSTPVASDATICVGQTAALSATGSGTIKWYNSATSTSVLASTAAYTTPALTTTTSYWVESEVTPANVGPTVATGTVTANASVANRYLIFNCTTPTKLKSVLINASAIGQIYVELSNSSGTVLEARIVRLTALGSQDINLDFFVPVGTGLRLVSRQISNTSLTCATTGITYPITSGPISITGNSGVGTFFQFFNWKLQPIKSNRNEVIVTVTPNPIVSTITPTNKLSGSTAFTLTVNGSNFVSGDATVRWNGTNRTTTFVNATQLTASITALDVATSGTATVTVFSTCNSSSTAAQTFTINSSCTAPVANITNLPSITAQCSATLVAPTATSNCYGQITGTTASPLTYSSQGTFSVTWTYNDGNGLTSTQNQQIVINDTTAPVANVTNLATVTGQCSATVTAPTALDNCSGTITGTTASPLTYSTQGTFNITWTYADARGNASTQTQQVIVNDTTAPVATVASLATVTGQCSATVTAPTATDN